LPEAAAADRQVSEAVR